MFVSGKLFKPSLMVVGKARAYPRGQHLKRCSTWVGSNLTHKHYTKLEKLATNKYSSLLRRFINYSHKKFYNIETRSLAPDHSAFPMAPPSQPRPRTGLAEFMSARRFPPHCKKIMKTKKYLKRHQ